MVTFFSWYKLRSLLKISLSAHGKFEINVFNNTSLTLGALSIAKFNKSMASFDGSGYFSKNDLKNPACKVD
ncbi:Uncharacterised protein [Chlamydia trachomatis]|nr:Uncharacterised protein [Chlamydia trachomatis]